MSGFSVKVKLTVLLLRVKAATAFSAS